MAKTFLFILVQYVTIIISNAVVLSNAQHLNEAAVVATSQIKTNQLAAADAVSVSQLTPQNYNFTHAITTQTTTTKDISGKNSINNSNSSLIVNNKFMNEYNASDGITNDTVSSSNTADNNERINADEKQSMKNLNSISMRNFNLSTTADLNVSRDDTFQLDPLEMSDLNANQGDLPMSNVEPSFASPSASTLDVFDVSASDKNGILTNGDGRLSRDIEGGGGGGTNFLNTRNIYKIAKTKPKTLATPTKKIDVGDDGEEGGTDDIDITEKENRTTYTPSTLPSASSSSSSSVMETLKFYGVNQSGEHFKSNLNIFQIITELYDQSRWKIDEIIKGVDDRQCGADMTVYIKSLNLAIPWAIKGKV